MALLKSGSTVGGNLIWHQGLLPVFPAGNKIYYKDYKIYTELDKPTPDELNMFTRPQMEKKYFRISSSPAGDVWVKFGTLVIAQSGRSAKFEVFGGVGYNGNPNQNAISTIVFRTGNNSSAINAAGRAGLRVFSMGQTPIKDVGAIETGKDTFDLYALIPSFILNSVMISTASSVDEIDKMWTPKWEVQATAPTFNIERTNETIYTTANKPNNVDVGLGNVTNDAQVKKAGDVMSGRLDISIPNSPNTNSVLALSSPSATPLILVKPGSRDYNISIQFKNDAITRFLGLGPNQELRWGTNLDQGSNAKVYTTEFKPTHVEVNAFYQSPGNLDETNLNDVIDPGQYSQAANAMALPTRNYPIQVAGTLTVLTSRANKWGRVQEYRPFNGSRIFTRFKTGESTWSTWSRVYTEADKPSYGELGLIPNSPVSDFNLNDGYIRKIDGSASSPDNQTYFGLHVPRSDGTYAMQLAARNNNFYVRSREGGAYKNWAQVYTTDRKPTNAEVGLGNVTNDAQIKRNGDTFNSRINNQGEWIGSGTANGGQFRAAYGNYGFIIRNDGSSTYFLLTKSGDPLGTWGEGPAGTSHPLQINNATRAIVTGSTLTATGQLRSSYNTDAPMVSTNGQTMTGSSACLIGGKVQGGAWSTWRERAAGITVDCFMSTNSAHNVWKATHWGQYHIAAMGVHVPSGNINNALAQLQVHNASFQFHANGTFIPSGPISTGSQITGGLLQSTGDFELKRNARRHIRWKDAGDEVDCYIYKDAGNSALRINMGRFGQDWQFQPDGTFYSSGNGNFNNVYIRSDERLKRNFKVIENARDKVEQLSGYIYDKKDFDGNYSIVEAGISAQELQKVLPESVIENSEGYLNVSATGVNALLINAVKELSEELKSMKQMIEELRK